MTGDLSFLVPLAIATFFLAGSIKGAIGIGLPTASIGLMAQFVDPRVAIALVIFPAMFTNAWQLWRMGQILRACQDYWRIIVVLMIVLWITTFFTASVPPDGLLIIVGGAVILFAASSLYFTPPRIPDPWNNAAQILTGAAIGVLGGLTAIWAPPMVAYLIGRTVSKDEFIRASGLLIFVGTLPLSVGFWQQGLFEGTTALLSAAMIIPALLGFRAGEMLRARLHADRFQSIVLVAFLLMGLNIISRALF